MLTRRKVCHIIGDQTVTIDHVKLFAGFLAVGPLEQHLHENLVGNADAGSPASENKDFVFRNRLIGDPDHRIHCSGHHHAGPLDIIIERADLIAVLFQYIGGVIAAEIFPVEQYIREQRRSLFNECFDEWVISLPGHAFVLVAKIELIFQQLFVVCARIDHNRQHLLRIQSRSDCVDGQFPDRNRDALDAPIADAQHPFAIRDDHHFDFFIHTFAAVQQSATDSFRTIHIQIHRVLGNLVIPRIIHDCVGNGRRIDYRQQLRHMFPDDMVKKHTVLGVDIHQVLLFGIGICQLTQLGIDNLSLLFQCTDCCRQQTFQSQSCPFFQSECGPFIQKWLTQ